MSLWDDFPGVNAGYVLELYDRYRQNPESVDAATRSYFEKWTIPAEPAAPGASKLPLDKITGAVNLAQALRSYGHLAATLDPLHGHAHGDPSLELATYSLTEDDLRQLPASLIGGPVAECAGDALQAAGTLRAIYTSTLGYSYEHIHDPSEREWLRHAAEARQFRPVSESFDPIGLLRRLTSVEVFEQFLQRTFPGKTRFSLEGLDMLVPVLDEIMCAAVGEGIRQILLGMAHRGRLNVMANVLGKPIRQILAEFRDTAKPSDPAAREELGWTGDVKYHLGARSPVGGDEPVGISIIMPPNPSHVEAINPVVEGMARAEGTQADTPLRGAPQFDPTISLPLLIHGDTAFPGEGIVAETLNLSRLPGYQTGGTIHIIANNQLGYTTTPEDGRSTLYASDLAKGFEIPIVHVNADDPEACVEAARLAAAYRARFHKDFLIDLIGYRRYGHNEGDEPSFTQPLLYQQIARHPTVRALWANTLIEREQIAQDLAAKLVEEDERRLQTILDSLRSEEESAETVPQPPPARRGAPYPDYAAAGRLAPVERSAAARARGFHAQSQAGTPDGAAAQGIG